MVSEISPAWERLRELDLVSSIEYVWSPGTLVVVAERGSGSFDRMTEAGSPFDRGVTTPAGHVSALTIATAVRYAHGSPVFGLVAAALKLVLGAAPRPLVLWVDAADNARLFYGRADGAAVAAALAESELDRFRRVLPHVVADVKRARAATHVVAIGAARWHDRLPGARPVASGLRVLTLPASVVHDLIVADLRACGFAAPVSPFDTYLPGAYPDRVPLVLLGQATIHTEVTRVLPSGLLVDLPVQMLRVRGGDA